MGYFVKHSKGGGNMTCCDFLSATHFSNFFKLIPMHTAMKQYTISPKLTPSQVQTVSTLSAAGPTKSFQDSRFNLRPG
jgi:hypothetical protein